MGVADPGREPGLALGPLAAAFIILPRGQASIAWFAMVALLGMAAFLTGSPPGLASLVLGVALGCCGVLWTERIAAAGSG